MVQAGLCQTWSETTLLVFSQDGSFVVLSCVGCLCIARVFHMFSSYACLYIPTFLEIIIAWCDKVLIEADSFIVDSVWSLLKHFSLILTSAVS